MMKLYQFPQSGNSRTSRIILLEKGLPFERVNIDFAKGEHKSEEFLKLNPKGKVPVLVDGDTVVCDSTEINEYLEEKFPGPPCLPAEDDARARARERVKYFDETFGRTAGLIILETLLKPPPARNKDLIAKKKEETLVCMETLEGYLQEDPWFTGDVFGLADAAYVPTFAVYPIIGMAIPDSMPKLADWWERAQQRPSFAPSAK